MDLEIGQTLWHPCSVDIIEHKITSIRQFKGFRHIVCKAVNSVGACGRIEVILDEHEGNLRFINLIDPDDRSAKLGLYDFVEGFYYTNKTQAQLDFYRIQKTLAWSRLKGLERQTQEAEYHYKQVSLLIDSFLKSLKDSENKQPDI